MDFLRALWDDLRQLDKLLLSGYPPAQLRGLAVGLMVMLVSAMATVVLLALAQ